ncbi:hypothetical protein MNB_SV-14-1029 [hydrothermal vent metagenome]|uniref:Uncharacterized protein n=1 Tax=hydrothermal vent metagenome TaxID=652676 RepID=A0A1W1CCM1_9ZZZZ
MYIQYWIDYVAQKKGISNGELISELIMSQPNFKNDIRELFEEYKPKEEN